MRASFGALGLHGRLGNQLFQVAGTLGIARAHGMEPLFPDAWPYRHVLSCPDDWFGPWLDDCSVLDSPLTAHIDPWFRTYLQDVALWWSVREVAR